jgi:hypothetical protein
MIDEFVEWIFVSLAAWYKGCAIGPMLEMYRGRL